MCICDTSGPDDHLPDHKDDTGFTFAQTTRRMAAEVYLDALPYIDQGYDEPGVRESVSPDENWAVIVFGFYIMRTNNTLNAILQAMQLVEEETRRYRPSKNYLEFLQPPKATFEVKVDESVEIMIECN